MKNLASAGVCRGRWCCESLGEASTWQLCPDGLTDFLIVGRHSYGRLN